MVYFREDGGVCYTLIQQIWKKLQKLYLHKVNENQEITRNRFQVVTGDLKRNTILRQLNTWLFAQIMCRYWHNINKYFVSK